MTDSTTPPANHVEDPLVWRNLPDPRGFDVDSNTHSGRLMDVDASEPRWRHIVEGDATGGGHVKDLQEQKAWRAWFQAETGDGVGVVTRLLRADWLNPGPDRTAAAQAIADLVGPAVREAFTFPFVIISRVRPEGSSADQGKPHVTALLSNGAQAEIERATGGLPNTLLSCYFGTVPGIPLGSDRLQTEYLFGRREKLVRRYSGRGHGGGRVLLARRRDTPAWGDQTNPSARKVAHEVKFISPTAWGFPSGRVGETWGDVDPPANPAGAAGVEEIPEDV